MAALKLPLVSVWLFLCHQNFFFAQSCPVEGLAQLSSWGGARAGGGGIIMLRLVVVVSRTPLLAFCVLLDGAT